MTPVIFERPQPCPADALPAPEKLKRLPMSDRSNHEALRHEVHAIGRDEDYDYIVEQLGDASTILLGEATHGTREFYRARAEISKRLIAGKGFDAIAVEADWPDALRVSR